VAALLAFTFGFLDNLTLAVGGVDGGNSATATPRRPLAPTAFMAWNFGTKKFLNIKMQCKSKLTCSKMI
jgi:hypothetical protein